MKTRLKCKLRACTAIACTFILSLSVLPVAADEDIESLQNKTSDLQSQLATINSELDGISSKIDETQMQIDVTSGEIERTQASLDEAKKTEKKHYDAAKDRIKFMYESGNTNLIQMLFSAKDMTDFLNKADFIQTISSYDREMLQELQAARQAVEDEQTTLKEQQDSLKTLQKDLVTQQDELKAKAEATSTDLVAYEKKLADAKAALAAANAAANTGNGGGRTETPGTPANSGSSVSVSASEVDVFAAILDCEAYRDYNCMLAVATVIMNRVSSPLFPNSISGVVYAPGQFQPVSTGKLARVLANGPSSIAYTVAKDALNGTRLKEVSHCYYFLYAPSTSRQGVIVGDNLFFASW